MKNLMLVKNQDAAIAYVSGKITKQGLTEGEGKGKKYVRFTLSVPTSDYDVHGAEYALGMKDAHLNTLGDNPKRPLIFVQCVAWEKTAELMAKNLTAGDTVQVLGLATDNEYNGTHTLNVSVSTWGKDFSETNVEVSDEDLPF